MNDLTACRGGMLYEYYHTLFQAADRERARRLAAVKSRVSAENYKSEIRDRLLKCFGEIPPLKILSSQVTGVLHTPKLVIEKIVIEARPGWFVPSLFYYPEACRKPLPGILHLCGHDKSGKTWKRNQEICQSLALRGFGVLCPDPFGQGERMEFGKGSANEHNTFGLRTGLLGNFFGTWRLHDALSALEYLRLRPEIDEHKIGVAGHSGGGTLTSYVNAFSDIPCMAASVCSITGMTRNLENEILTDCEQNPPDFKRLALEEADLFLSKAPRPCYLGIQDNDFFDPRGTEEAAAELRHFYRHFNADDKVVVGRGTGNHEFSRFHCHSIGQFFGALAGSQTVGNDDDIAVFPEDQLFCAPGGDVRNIPHSKPAQAVLNDLLRQNTISEDMHSLKDFLRIRTPDVPAFRKRFPQYFENLQLHAARILLNTEPGIEVALKKIGRTVRNKLELDPEITLLLPEKTGVSEFPEPENCYLLEVRGVGETLSCPPDADLMYIDSSLYAACGFVTGKSIFSGQVHDLLSCLAFLKEHHVRKVNLIPKGAMTYIALTAAQWSPLPLTIEMDALPESWSDFVRHPDKQLPRACLPFGILRHADVSQLAAAAYQNESKANVKEFLS